MATRRWLGRAAATFHKVTITVANTWATGDTGTITINGKNLVLTVGAATATTDVAAALTAMFNGSAAVGTETRSNTGDQYPEFAEITAVQSSSTVILTHDTAGVPFTATVSENTAGSGTLSAATTVTATGPSFWNDANNWDGGAVPVTGDDVFIDNSNVDILYGLSQSSETLSTLSIALSYSGKIGLPKTNAGGYPEYRADYLAISATTVTVGRGSGVGSGRIKIDFGANATTIEVVNTGFGLETDLEALLIKGTHATNVLEVHAGSVGVAPHGNDSSVLATLRNAGGAVQTYANCTVTTCTVSGGSTILNKAPTTLTQKGGTTTILGSGAVTTLAVSAGACNYQSSGTVTTASIGGLGEALVDCGGDISPRTFTTTTLDRGGRILDPNQTITFTNAVARGSNARELSAA